MYIYVLKDEKCFLRKLNNVCYFSYFKNLLMEFVEKKM